MFESQHIDERKENRHENLVLYEQPVEVEPGQEQTESMGKTFGRTGKGKLPPLEHKPSTVEILN